jgi:outer membrane protein
MPIVRWPADLVLVSGLAMAAAGGARGETLGDAMALAYQSNPTLQAQRATQRALDETYVQAMANLRPQITVTSTVSSESNNEVGDTTGRLAGRTQLNSNSIQISQPLYTGGRIEADISAAVAGVLAGRETLRAAEETTLQNVVQVYVDVRRDQESVEIAQENVELLQRQLDESHSRFAVGDITRTDVAQTQTRVAAARAQLANAQAQLATSRATYLSVVGENPGTLAPEPPLAKLLPDTIDKALDMAEQNSPHIREADYTEQSSAAKVAEAKAQTRPSLSLQATLGYYGGANSTPPEFTDIHPNVSPFVDYSRDITASASASFPLFSGGYYSSQIRQAAENNNVDRINIETNRRQVLLAVSQAWNQLVGARASLAADGEQVQAANIAFEGTRQEARVGLRTTLDVLISEEDLANAQLALVGARHDEYFAAAALLAAMGSLEAADFVPDLVVYDPRTNFDHVKNANRMPWDGLVEYLDGLAAPHIIERPATVRVEDSAKGDGAKADDTNDPAPQN